LENEPLADALEKVKSQKSIESLFNFLFNFVRLKQKLSKKASEKISQP